jgi:hypothetical protein
MAVERNQIMPNLFNLTLAAFSLGLVGCVPIAPPSKLSLSNPASPNAAEAGYPAAMPVLMTGNNYAMSPEGEESMKMDMPMDKKMNMPPPGSAPMKMPQHEGQAQPSTAPMAHEHQEANAPKQ